MEDKNIREKGLSGFATVIASLPECGSIPPILGRRPPTCGMLPHSGKRSTAALMELAPRS
jgi:hypothetical protein